VTLNIFDEDDAPVSPEIQEAVEREVESLKREGKLVRIEPRCKICRNPPLREAVNKMLTMGLTRSGIVDVLETINADKPDEEKVTYPQVYRHQKRHFNVSQPAQAVYEAIVAKRQADNENDFEAAIGAAVNVFSYYETMMVKGFAHLRDESTVVPYTDGARAARELHELTRKDAGAQQVAEIMARQNRIISAIQDFVPEDKIGALMARIEGGAELDTIDATVVDDEVVPDRAYDPDEAEFDDEDD
jgi:hypothetical protein